MNSLERTLIRKSGYDHGWEVIVEEVPEQVVLSSALHASKAKVKPGTAQRWLISFSSPTLARELRMQHELQSTDQEEFGVPNEQQLGWLLGQAARLARSLPNAPETRFEETVAKELSVANALGATEVEATIRRRVGQGIYRETLMDYWGGACAVTGIAMPELLRASHAKPWAECATAAERLNVFNGFLLVANLDALFDRFLITFSPEGEVICSSKISSGIRTQLGLNQTLKLRWLTENHNPFLDWHRTKFYRLSESQD